jgi:hypothetical protein
VVTGEAPPVPRYPDISPSRWAAVESFVTALVLKRAGEALGDPRAIAAEALHRAQDPLVANGFRKLEKATTSQVEPGELEELAISDRDTEKEYEEAKAEAIAATKLAKLRDILPDDRCCLLLLDAVTCGDRKPFEKAMAGGFSYREVKLARGKIGRAAVRIREDEARAQRMKGFSP